MAVDDEIWRPGYGGPAPVSGETSLDRATSADDLPMAAGRRSWRLVAAVVALGAVAVTAVVVIGSQAPDLDARSAIEETPPIDVIDDDRLEFATSEPTALGGGGPLQLLDDPSAPYAGADTRRLPMDVVPRWTTALPPLVADGGANATTWVEAVDSRSVIVGIVLLLETDGGSAQTLVDAASGETIVALTMSPGLFGVLEVAGNGIITGRTSRDGSRVAGLDLDGNELWALDGSTPVSIGDGIVARSTPQPDGSFEVTAYGDPG
ncbi:MAG: hypothetical protein WA964_01700 [Ilumatobacter sp.]|uniref:hypothetical protein n=1 Tax=Ilumatobacter sp. TaxID=1967498 RepID=UPI003C7413FC